jgi:hypothetical protein
LGDETDAISTVEAWISQFEKTIAECRRGPVDRLAAGQMDDQMMTEVERVLTRDSVAWRLFDSRIRQATLWLSAAPYLRPKDAAALGRRVAALREIADALAPTEVREAMLAQRHYHIGAGQRGRALSIALGLMKEANSDLLVVDAYADDALMRLIAGLDPKVRVRIVIGRADPSIQTMREAYRADGRAIELRKAKTIHDRYLVIDHAAVWSMGASFNRFGAKAHDIMRTTEEPARSDQVAEFEAAWKNGEPL